MRYFAEDNNIDKRFWLTYSKKKDGTIYYQIYDVTTLKYSKIHYRTLKAARLKRRAMELELEWKKFYKEHGGCEEDWQGKVKGKGKRILERLDTIAEELCFCC